MKHNCNASPGEGQSDGPSPWLLSPQAALLPGLGPRPSSSLSWPLPWGCSTGKVPIGGPSCDPSSRMGAAPHSGAPAVSQLDTSAPELSPPISHYDHHYSHYDHRSHTHRSHTPLSHTTLTQDTLTHHSQTHCSHTRTTALTPRPSALRSLEEMARRLCLQHVSRESGTGNPLSHKGLRGNRGAGLRPTIKGAERGEGLPKRRQMSVGCRRRKAVPTAQAHHQTRPCKDTGSQSNQIVETASETTTTRNEHVF